MCCFTACMTRTDNDDIVCEIRFHFPFCTIISVCKSTESFSLQHKYRGFSAAGNILPAQSKKRVLAAKMMRRPTNCAEGYNKGPERTLRAFII